MSSVIVCPRGRAHIFRIRPCVFTHGGTAISSVIGARHPVGLYLLCVVELGERFAGSLLGSPLLLYLNERIGLSPGIATRLGGAFNAAVYLPSVPGGV